MNKRKGWYYEPSKYCKGLFDVYYNGGLYAVIGENLAKKFCTQVTNPKSDSLTLTRK